jgi:hypothetical protein
MMRGEKCGKVDDLYCITAGYSVFSVEKFHTTLDTMPAGKYKYGAADTAS